jgi:hypothetical protein
MEVSGQLHTPSRFIPRERVPATHWTGGWVGRRAVPDAEVKRKIPSCRRESNPRTPIVQPIERWLWMLNWKWGRGWAKPWRNPFRISGLQAENRNRDLPNMKQESCLFNCSYRCVVVTTVLKSSVSFSAVGYLNSYSRRKEIFNQTKHHFIATVTRYLSTCNLWQKCCKLGVDGIRFHYALSNQVLGANEQSSRQKLLLSALFYQS